MTPAENVWRIAMEFAGVAGNPRPTAYFEAAFRAEVEAEARAFAQREHPYADLHVEALAEIKATIDGNSDQPVAAIIEGLLQEIKVRSDRLSRLKAKGESHEVTSEQG